jgi:hypothetical protein
VRFHLGFRPLVFALIAVVTFIAGCNPAPTPPPPSAAIALEPIEVIGVGDVRPGATSESTIVIRVTELETASIPRGPGTFELVLSDSGGGGDAVSFWGAPTVVAPGSLGVTAVVTRSNVLTVEIVDSDTFNIEQLTIEGLQLRASESAPAGALGLRVGACSGSLAGCTADPDLASPGSVVASS